MKSCFCIVPRLELTETCVFRRPCLRQPCEAVWKLFFYSLQPAAVKRGGGGGVRPLHRPRSAILGRAITYESQGHHEMGPQTSYKQKKTTILKHFSRPESWYHSFSQILTFKIRFSDLQNSLFRPSKFGFIPSKFALQGLTHEPKKSIEIRGRELKYCLK